jgi:hypothetical protein
MRLGNDIFAERQLVLPGAGVCRQGHLLCHQLHGPLREKPKPAECGDRNRRQINYLEQGLESGSLAAYRWQFAT